MVGTQEIRVNDFDSASIYCAYPMCRAIHSVLENTMGTKRRASKAQWLTGWTLEIWP